jgi:hypothetical protein
MQSKKSEIWVGIFMIMALLAALFRRFKVNGHRADVEALRHL